MPNPIHAAASGADSSPASGNEGEAPAALGPSFSPLYQQIKSLLVRSLQAGEWRPGEAIPSEVELAARFKVSQGTVRKAIDELASENLLVRRQGKGTFVATHAEERVQYRFLRLTPDEPDTISAPGTVKRELLDCRRLCYRRAREGCCRLPPFACTRRHCPRFEPQGGRHSGRNTPCASFFWQAGRPGRHLVARASVQGAHC